MKLKLTFLFIILSVSTIFGQQQAKGIAITYTLPSGWQVMQEEYGSILLGHKTIPGLILLQEHAYNGREKVLTELAAGINSDGILLQANSGVRQLNNNAYFATYQGQVQGQPTKAAAVTSLSKLWQIGGVMVMTMVRSDLYNNSYETLVTNLANSIQYRPFMDTQAQQWATLVKGRKLVNIESYSTSTTTNGGYGGENSVSSSSRTEVHLCSNGWFSIANQSNSSMSMSGGMGGTDRSKDQNKGLWVLMNIANTPVFRLAFEDGEIEYHAVEDYANDQIYIGGKRFVIAGSNLCQ